MDKPRTMSVQDYLIRVMSHKINTSVKIIEAVIIHQTQALNKALQHDEIFSAELSGFGKFIFNHKKAQKKYDKNLSKEIFFTTLLLDPENTDKQKQSNTLKLENTKKWLEGIKTKLQKCPSLQNISTLQ
jgi:nucleoid DNA-binding protein